VDKNIKKRRKINKLVTYSACIERGSSISISRVVGTSEHHCDEEEAEDNRDTHVYV
jgi:hypothetical protein